MPESETIACTRCHAANRTGRRFCTACGAALPLACPACGFSNEADDKFCGGCGAPLATSGAAASPPVRGDALEAERRPVTVLFADLCGYTKLSQTLDAEDMHDLLGRFFETLDVIVGRWGGSIDKHIGDSVMAVFGAPIAHGDEATRAVRCALEMHHAVGVLSTELARPLAVHIGIAAGEVMASGLGSAQHRAYTVIGHSVNLASRLLQLAGSGETVIDHAVHAATEGVASCTLIDGVGVKGVEAPIRVWRVSELAGAAGPDRRQAFVGRRTELAQLTAVLEACRSSGSGSAVCVRGEAGIGKSRLIEELRRIAIAQSFACHTGLVLDFGMAKGRDAIRELVKSLLGLSPAASTEDRLSALERALASGACTEEQRPFLADLLDLPQQAADRALYEAMENALRQRGRGETLVALLQAASRERPLLLTIEDVQWADKPTLEYLATLGRYVGAMPVVLAMTSRIDGDPLDAAWRASMHGSALVTVDLGPLRAEESLALASGMFSAQDRFALKCVERAAGNPLFLEQLLRGAEKNEEQLPVSLHSLVLARMDRLPERDRTALRAASVIGQRFSLPLLRRLSNLLDYACDNLQAHYLVRAEGEEFLFAHALIRDGVYASLTKARRREQHRAAAAYFEDKDPTLHAEHLDRAEAPEAPQAYLRAAQAQAAALHQERALSLAERGVALARDRPDIFALNMLRGELFRQSGEGKPALEAYQAALAVSAAPAERCRALLGVAAAHRLIAGVDAALDALAEAEPIARAHELTRELAELHYTRGNLHFARGRLVDCRAAHEAALACALAVADKPSEARAISGLADADYAEGRMRTAFERFTRCVSLCDANGYTRISIANRMMIGFCRIFLAEFDAGLRDMEKARDVAVQVGDRHGEMLTSESSGMLLSACSRYSEAAPRLERGLPMAEALGARRYQAVILATQAVFSVASGRADEAMERLIVALALARETGMGFCGPMVLGLMACASADAAERERCLGEAQALLGDGCIGHNYFFFYRFGIEDAIARCEWDAALHHASALAEYTQREPVLYSDLLIARARTLAALAQQPQDTALHDRLSGLRAETDRLHWPIHWPDWALKGTAPRPAASWV